MVMAAAILLAAGCTSKPAADSTAENEKKFQEMMAGATLVGHSTRTGKEGLAPGEERYTIHGLDTLKPGQLVEVRAVDEAGRVTTFATRARVDNETEIGYLHHGGILPLVLRELIAKT